MCVCKNKLGSQESNFLNFVEDSLSKKVEEKKFWINEKKETYKDWIGRGIAMGVLLSVFIPAIIGIIISLI